MPDEQRPQQPPQQPPEEKFDPLKYMGMKSDFQIPDFVRVNFVRILFGVGIVAMILIGAFSDHREVPAKQPVPPEQFKEEY